MTRLIASGLTLAMAGLVVFTTPSTALSDNSAQNYREQYLQRFENHRNLYLERWEQYRAKVAAVWGDQTIISDNHVYVSYSDDLNERSVIDYENNSISFDVIADDTTVASTRDDIARLIQRFSETSVTEAAHTDPVIQLADSDDERSILSTFAPGSSVDDLVNEADISTASFEVNDATQKRVERITLSLPDTDIFLNRAQPFLPDVAELSAQYNIPADLILAIAQVESSFNPLAQSPVPAFGLMQIVPNTAGLDVNRLVFSHDQAPTQEQLFQSDVNLEFGTAYLNILYNNYLKGIESPISRFYCTIAAYNTGAGNVARAFHPQGLRSIHGAVNEINQLTPDQVYEQLLAKLPYAETVNYLPKVLTAQERYR